MLGGKGGGLFQAAPPANPLRARGPRGPGRLSRGGAEVLFADVFLGCERSGRPVPGERPRAWGGVRAAARRDEPPILRGTIVRLPRPCSVPKGKPVARPLTGLRVEEGSQPRGFPQHGRSSKPTARAAPARRETPRDVNRGTPTAPAQARRSLQHGFGSKLSHRESVQATQPRARPRTGPKCLLVCTAFHISRPLSQADRMKRAKDASADSNYIPIGGSELRGADQAPGCVGAPVSIATHRCFGPTGPLGLSEGPPPAIKGGPGGAGPPWRAPPAGAVRRSERHPRARG